MSLSAKRKKEEEYNLKYYGKYSDEYIKDLSKDRKREGAYF